MSAVFSLLTVMTLSLLITRLAVAALMLTGISHEVARLQTISAFTGIGFTTSESELIVNHPVRRRILILLMIVGNAGFVTSASTLILSFAGVTTRTERLERGLWLLAGLVGLLLVARSKWIEKRMLRLMSWALRRWTNLEAYDFVELLNLAGEYRVRTIVVGPDDWVAGRRLEELNLLDEGVTVLGIHRPDGAYVGVPRGETTVLAGDRLVVYGRHERLGELGDRKGGPAGAETHRRAVADQQQRRQAQRRHDETSAWDPLVG
jgi:hypothetical protein